MHVECTYLKLVHHKIVSKYSPWNTNENHVHFKNCVKSIRNTEFLKPEVGTLFQRNHHSMFAVIVTNNCLKEYFEKVLNTNRKLELQRQLP